MLYTHIAAALIGAALASIGTWHVQESRIANMKAAAAQEKLVAEQTAYNIATERMKEMQDAQRRSAAAARASAAAASAARSERDGLRDDLATALQAHSSSLGACRQYADTVGGLFAQCGEALTGLAVQAQGHLNDTRMLLDAWPR